MSDPKGFVFDAVEHNRDAIALLCDNIFYYAELGMQEFETSKLMMELLEKAGFKNSACSPFRPTTPAKCPGSYRPASSLFHPIFLGCRTITGPRACLWRLRSLTKAQWRARKRWPDRHWTYFLSPNWSRKPRKRSKMKSEIPNTARCCRRSKSRRWN